jgi:uncharacterized alpha-E superfamily protein
MSTGMSIERASAMCTILARVLDDDVPEGAFDLALELGDSTMAHRGRFMKPAGPDSLTGILALDAQNPRSVMYHLDRLRGHVDALPRTRRGGLLSPVARCMLEAHTALAIQTPETLDAAALRALRARIWDLSELLAETYMR